MNCRFRAIFTALLLTGRLAFAQEKIFDFSDLDIVDPAASEKGKEAEAERPPLEDDPLTNMPEAIRTVLRKLDRFATIKRQTLMKEIVDGRKIVSEMLVKNAASTDAASRPALLGEATRVESLPPEQPLILSPQASRAKGSPAPAATVLGSWKITNNNSWGNTLFADGSLVRPGGATGTWRWVDEKRGVFVLDYTPKSPGADLVQIDLKSKPLKARMLDDWNSTYPLEKSQPPEKPAAAGAAPLKGALATPVVKQAARETERRKETETLIQSKNVKVAAWLLQQAKGLPAPQARFAVERATELEGKPAAPASSRPAAPATAAAPGTPAAGKDPGDFAGVWVWAGKKMEFSPDGSVKVNNAKAGRWVWAKANSRSHIAFVVDIGDVVAMARLSKSQEGVMHICSVAGKKTQAKRQ